MTNNPLLSIITVNKNNCRGLERTLNSINFVRNRPDIELIFVDGGSDDKSLLVARKFYDDNNIITGPDSGVYHGMNRGLFRARGKYSLFLNSGDEIIPTNFDAVISIIQDSTYDVISFTSLMIKEGTLEIFGIHRMSLPDRKDNQLSIPHQSTCYQTHLLQNIGGYSVSFKSAGDYDLNHRLFCSRLPKFYSLDFPLSKFYLGGISSTKIGILESLFVEYSYGRRGVVSFCFEFLKNSLAWNIRGLRDQMIWRRKNNPQIL